MGFVRIIPNVFEFTYHGVHSSGRAIDNVIAVHATTDGWDVPADRQTIFDDVRDAWQSEILDQLGNTYTFEGISWIDLRTLDGETGTIAPNVGLPTVGQLAGSQATAQVAFLVHKAGTTKRNQRPGRWYLAPVVETDVDQNGFVAAARQTALNASLLAYFNQVDQTVEDSVVTLRTIHVQIPPGPPPAEPEPVLGDSSEITTLLCDDRVATQRRRLRA